MIKHILIIHKIKRKIRLKKKHTTPRLTLFVINNYIHEDHADYTGNKGFDQQENVNRSRGFYIVKRQLYSFDKQHHRCMGK